MSLWSHFRKMDSSLRNPWAKRTGSFPARSVHTLASRGKRGWLAMRVLQRPAKSRSSSSASQQSLPSHSVWPRLNPVLTAVGFLLLGQACFSEWRLMASFPGCSSILPLFCLFCSPSRWFCHLSRAERPVLNSFRSSDQHELFNNLVAQFVGL